LKRDIGRGIDPLGVKEKNRAEPTMKELAAQFIEQHVCLKRPETSASYRRHLKDIILPDLGRLKVKDVRRHHVVTMHRKVSEKRGDVSGNRVLATLSALMAFAITLEHRSDNPCQGIRRNYEEGRSRYLSQQEIAALLDVLRGWPDQQVADAIRLLLLTGARRAEVMRAEWSQFEELGVWKKPSSHTKQKRRHEVPLSAPAMALISRMRAEAEPGARYLFPSALRPGQPIGQLSHVWPKIARAAGIRECHLHDLRHSYASILVSGGASLPLIGRLLGHASSVTTQRYSHFYRSPLQEAAERAAAVITAAEVETSAEVTPLPTRRAK
jgi:integrase